MMNEMNYKQNYRRQTISDLTITHRIILSNIEKNISMIE